MDRTITILGTIERILYSQPFDLTTQSPTLPTPQLNSPLQLPPNLFNPPPPPVGSNNVGFGGSSGSRDGMWDAEPAPLQRYDSKTLGRGRGFGRRDGFGSDGRGGYGFGGNKGRGRSQESNRGSGLGNGGRDGFNDDAFGNGGSRGFGLIRGFGHGRGGRRPSHISNGYPRDGTFPDKNKNKRRRPPPPFRPKRGENQRYPNRGQQEPPRNNPSRFWKNPNDAQKSLDAGWLGPKEGRTLYRTVSPKPGPSRHRSRSPSRYRFRSSRSFSRSPDGSPLGGRRPVTQNSDSKINDVFNTHFSSSLSLGPDEALVSLEAQSPRIETVPSVKPANHATHTPIKFP